MPESYDDLIGLPWELGANGPDTYDCWGLACEVLRRQGYELDDEIGEKWIRSYTPGETDPGCISERECELHEIPRSPGDMLVMRGVDSEDGRATHVAVHIGENLVIQSTRKIGVHIIPFKKVAPYVVEVISWV